MDGFFDVVNLDLPCHHCGHTFSMRLSDTKRESAFVCPQCDRAFNAKDFAAEIQEAEDAISRFRKTFRPH